MAVPLAGPERVAAPPAAGRWWPWAVCGFLLLATALSYLDRQALGVVGPLVRSELGLDNADLGLLLSAFFYTYAVVHLFVGWVLDRYNIRVTYALFVVLWSLAQVGSGLAAGFWGLFAARMFLGAFETAGQTGAARIIARILPGKDRALANGVMMSGGSLGAMVAGPLMLGLAATVGWRYGFMVLGGFGLVWAAAWLWWFRPPPHVLYGPAGDGRPADPADRWGVILTNPRFWACVAGAATTIPIIHIMGSWVPTYLDQRWGLAGGGLATALVVVYLGMDLGFVGGGAVISGLIRRGSGVARARKVVMAAAAGLMLAAAAVPLAPGGAAAVGLVFLMLVGRAAWGAIFLAFNQDIAPGRVGMVAGVMGCVGSLAGALLIWGVGLWSKAAGFDGPFLMLAALAVLGSVPMLLVNWDDEAPAARPEGG